MSPLSVLFVNMGKSFVLLSPYSFGILIFYVMLILFILTQTSSSHSYLVCLHLFLISELNTLFIVEFLVIVCCHFFIISKMSSIIHSSFSFFFSMILHSDVISISLNVFHFEFSVWFYILYMLLNLSIYISLQHGTVMSLFYCILGIDFF